MNATETKRVQAFIQRHRLDAEVFPTPAGVPTVEAAAAALGVSVDQIIKTLIFTGPADELVIAVACGTAKVDRAKLAEASGLARVRIAAPDAVFATTGYPAGGVAPVDLPERAIVVVDTAVAEQPVLYGGSGDELHMLRIKSVDIVRLNRATIAPILCELAV